MALGLGFFTVFITAMVLMGYFFYRQMKLWYLMSKFPGPRALPFIGNAHQFDPDPREFFRQISLWTSEFSNGGANVIRFWIGHNPAVFTFNANDTETILSSSKQLDKGFFYKFLVPWLGTGLLISKGQKWFQRRKLLTPSFHFSVLTSFLDVFNENSLTLSNKFAALTNKKVNIFPMMTQCTLDIICDTAMGKHIGAQEGKNSKYVQAVLGMSDLVQERQKYPWLWIDPIYYRLNSGKKQLEYLDILHGMTNSVIKEKMAERLQNKKDGKMSSSMSSTGRKRLAFLDLLLEVNEEDPSFDIDSIREEVDTFMFEGHDTTAAAISWVLFNLGQYPEIQKKVHDELDSVFGNDYERPCTSDDLANLQYLTCVIKETLRLFPSVPIIARELEEDTHLYGNYVPKKTIAVIGIYWLHRDPKNFPDPEKFDPDRFLPENTVGRHPFAYVPFSAGPRNCIGQKFALMEEKVVISTLMRRYQIKSLQTLEEVSPIGELILRPHDGIDMLFQARH